MPYRINPKNPRQVQKKVNGRWTHKAWCKSAASAKRMLNLLHGVETGWRPTGAKAKDKNRGYLWH